MKKSIILLLLIVNAPVTHAMNNDVWFPKLRHALSTWFSFTPTSDESKLVTKLRANKNALENKLRDKQVKYLLENNERMTMQAFSIITITNPLKFLQYCYYLKFHEAIFNVHLHDLVDFRAIDQCQKAQLDGYSGLGAAIISENTSIKEKREFIQKLLNFGIKPTSKDIELARLDLYDTIKPHHFTILHLLSAQPKANWLILPQDIRTLIARYMIQLFKSDFWLLPEIY